MLPYLLACTFQKRVTPVPEPPFTPGPVRFEQPHLRDTLLFAEELRPVEDAAAAFLAERGYTVLSRMEQDAVIAEATQGCPTPPSPARVLSHHFPDTATVRLRAQCFEDCTLTLSTHTAPSIHSRGRTARWQAPLSGSPDVETVLAAIPLLTFFEKNTPADVVGGFVDGPDQDHTGRGVVISRVHTAGGWTSEDLYAALSSLELKACWADTHREYRDNPVRVSVSAEGQVVRCEPTDPRHFAAPEGDCACALLAEVDLGEGPADRRGSFDLTSFQPSAVNATGQIVRASPGGLESETDGLTWAGTGMGSHVLSACFARTPQAEDASIRLRYEVGADGVPTSWSADWPAWAGPETTDCLADLLPTARFTGPVAGVGGEVSATVQIPVR